MIKTWIKGALSVLMLVLGMMLIGCHEHLFGAWTVAQAPTCDRVGAEVRVCECGAEERREVAVVAHTYGDWVITSVSLCDTKGTLQRSCTVCGGVEERALEPDPTKHHYGAWVETKAATCFEDGSQTRQCPCGAFETAVVTKLEHDVVIDAAKAPTTVEAGLTEGSHCSRCHTVFVTQETVDKLKVHVLDGLRYQGDTTGALIFFWDVNKDYAAALEKIRVTVENGSTESSYELAPDAASWAYQVTGEQATYTFTFEPVIDVVGDIAVVAAEFYWMPQLTALDFPRLEITTEEGELPTFTKVSAPEGAMGAGITDAKYVQSMISLYNSDNELLYSTADKGFDGAKIKIRGNTSAYAKKTPFKIKLDKKADLLAGLVVREDGVNYKDKNWVLLASGYASNVAIGSTVSELVGMDWVPAYTYVSLFVNGEYRGLYILIEGVEQSEARCDVSDEGYVFEMDAYWWNEDLYFTTPLSVNSANKYTFKYPDAEDFDENSEIYSYIRQYMTDFESALFGGEDITQYIDLQSFAKWLLVHDILATYDVNGTNIYLTKYDNTADSTVRMGPTWDFDSICWSMSMGMPDHLARIRESGIFYIPWLLQNQQFLEIYDAEYAAVRNQITDALETELAKYDSDAYRTLVACDGLRWGVDREDTIPTAEQILNWFELHLSWMDENV